MQSIHVSQIVCAGIKSLFGEERLDCFRQEAALLNFSQWNPFHADLLLVMLGAGADAVRVGQVTAKDVLHLVKSVVCFAKFVVFANILSDVEQLANFNCCADFLKAFALQPLDRKSVV